MQAHLLRPMAKNKMYRAELVPTDLGGRLRRPTIATGLLGEAQKNMEHLKELLPSTPQQSVLTLDGNSTMALVWRVEPDAMLAFLRSCRWQTGAALRSARGRPPHEREAHPAWWPTSGRRGTCRPSSG
ncbi:MAG: hypothetical protein ACYDAN_14210 [Candidatus Limnocylindrales bacterium]